MKGLDFDLFSPDIFKLTKKLHEQKNKKLSEHDLKVTNARCLCRIAQSGSEGMSATEIAHACEIDKAQISRCMLELTQRGCVVRMDDGKRRYKQKYHLTEEGERIANDLMQSAVQIRDILGKDVSDEELSAFCATLEKICRNFDAVCDQ